MPDISVAALVSYTYVPALVALGKEIPVLVEGFEGAGVVLLLLLLLLSVCVCPPPDGSLAGVRGSSAMHSKIVIATSIEASRITVTASNTQKPFDTEVRGC